MAADHELGFMHGDLKPNNVGVSDQFGELLVKILDFGRVLNSNQTTLTWTQGMPLVTEWTVPEHVKVHLQGRSDYPIHPSVEVLVVGVILGHLVGCRLWPAGMSEASYILLLASGCFQLPWLASGTPFTFCNEAVPVAYQQLVDRCLSSDPALRPPMAVVAKDLQVIITTL
ncbi:hypothetical protein ABBQ32_013055 [Trebouxia sp. C0010 RCD-2024]